MKVETDRQHEGNHPEQESSVLDQLLLLNGIPAREHILQRIQTFPVRTIVVFGEPGIGKTLISSGLGDLARQQGMEVQMTTYDSVSARIVEELGREKPQWSDEDYDHLSEELLEDYLGKHSPGPSKMQIVELVGIGIRNRAISTLLSLMDQASRESATESSFLFIGVAPDIRIQEEASSERRRVARLPAEEIIRFLESKNVQIDGLDSAASDEEKGQAIKGFYSSMARGFQIEIVRAEVEKQAETYISGDLQRFFELIDPPSTIIKKRSSKRADNYRRKATFLELFLDEQGLLAQAPHQSISPSIWDKGIVVYNHYDPKIKRRIDLSLYRYNQSELTTGPRPGMY